MKLTHKQLVSGSIAIGLMGSLVVALHEPMEACKGCGIPAVDGITLFGMVMMGISAALALLADRHDR